LQEGTQWVQFWVHFFYQWVQFYWRLKSIFVARFAARLARPFPNVVNADNSTAPIDYGHSIRNYGSITGVVNIAA